MLAQNRVLKHVPGTSGDKLHWNSWRLNDPTNDVRPLRGHGHVGVLCS